MKETIYKKDIEPRLDDIAKWIEQGLTQEQIANNLNVNRRTFQRAIDNENDLKKLFEEKRKICVKVLENALYKSAIGYYTEEEQPIKVKFEVYENGVKKKGEKIITQKVKVYHEPNPQSAIFLLKNWAKDEKYANEPAMLELKEKELERKNGSDENDSPIGWGLNNISNTTYKKAG